MVNIPIKNRIELAIYFRNLGFKKGAEIGVFDGRYSEILCQNIPKLILICVDIWPKEPIYQMAKDRLANYGVALVRKSSMEAAKEVRDESLDFVFIDADHKYNAVKKDITLWSKKVKAGGIVSGHDYYVFKFSGNRGVIDAVDEYTREHGHQLHTTVQDWGARSRDDRQPCWYFYKK